MSVEMITVTDLRRAGHCASGIKRWFDAHDLDFRDFVKNGIAVETFVAAGDGLALDAVRRMRERRDG